MTVGAATGAGALGARMIGGGFGGSVIALAGRGFGRVRAAVTDEFGRRDWRPPRFLDATPSAGAHRVRSAGAASG